MAQHIPETVFTGSPSNAEGPSVLHERNFLRLAPALDFSTEEWLRISRAHNNGTPSVRREVFRETLDQQLMSLSWSIHDDDPCPESLELSRRVEALPRILKLTVLEAIERFWTNESEASSWDERLQHLGLRPCASAHERLAALAHREYILSKLDGLLR